MSKSKFVGVALATFVAASLTACGGSEEKETRAVPSHWNDKAMSFVAPKSYVRENKSVTPPFVAISVATKEKDGMDGFAIAADEQSQKDIVDIKVNNGECKARLTTEMFNNAGESPLIAMEMNFCDIKQVELTTKAGKVTYKF